MTTLPSTPQALSALREIDGAIKGDVRSDRLARALYSTDASIYEMVPDGVVWPRCVEDVVATVKACGRNGVPVTARGAGTGLAGGAVNRGISLDCSRYLNRILSVDVANRTVIVEPGVVLDELNSAMAGHGLHFAADVATSSRATLGGMIANNSCGAHSVMYGCTVDHVTSLDVVLSNGSIARWGRDAGASTDRARDCEAILETVQVEYAEEIARRFPKVMRSNGGYALDRLRREDGRINAETIICGSEGTLGIVVAATLRLTPLPRCKGLIVAHFHELLDALEATPIALRHRPAAVELIDRLIMEASRAHPAMGRPALMLQGDPSALLVIELYDDDEDSLRRRLQAVVDDLVSQNMGYAHPILLDPVEQTLLWNIRKSGLGLLMSKPGDRQPYDFVDDTAVDPSRLREYIERFMVILGEEGVSDCSYYAHASVGCLHVKPVLNLRDKNDVARMYRVADRISSLALEFNGANTGEHGDGLVRSEWLGKMYGPRLIEAFGRIKAVFDPQNIFNPGKIVSPLGMTEHLRFESPRREPHNTVLDFSLHGGMAGLAEMCSGVGQCRQKQVGTMCPSYMATGEEAHTTRARANALRVALSDRGLLDGLADPALDEVMDLCLSCKACKTECPTGVDMAKLKAEWLHARNSRRGVPLRSRLIARMPAYLPVVSRAAPLVNAIAQSKPGRWLAEKLVQLDRRVPPPRLARQTLRDWFAARRGTPTTGGARGRVAIFVDTWTNYFTPQVGIAATHVLEALGFQVLLAPNVCCGRPAISKGMLDEARRLAERNVRFLSELANAAVPLVGLEPSCILTFADEFPQLVRTPMARRIAELAMPIESFLARQIESYAVTTSIADRVLYHGHCHQKAMVGTADAMKLMRWATGGGAAEINSGCCGMAGSFGHESEHYDVARLVGEQRLFPAVRNRGRARIVVSGFSCRHQIEHHTGAKCCHVVELIAGAMKR